MPDETYWGASVSAADISRNFGEWQSKAMVKPVVITHHGRARLVLQSIDEFERRGAGAPCAADEESQHTTARLRSILGQIQEGFFAIDPDFRLTDVNRVGELYFGVAREDMIGKDLRDMVPETRRSLAWDYMRRVLQSGEAADSNVRSTVRPGSTINIRAFPYANGVGVIFANMTAQEEARLIQSWWRALLAAVHIDPSVALIRLDMRGGIAAVDENFCAMTGFGEEQLLTLLLAEIVPQHERIALGRAINEAMRDRGAKIVNLNIMTKDGAERRLKLSLSPILAEPVPEGLVVVVTDLGLVDETRSAA